MAKKGRPIVTDAAAVRVPSTTAGRVYDYVVSRSYGEVVDLLSEGPIEGIASGSYSYKGEKNLTGYQKVTFKQYEATGADGVSAKALGFLRSIYWNEIPLVDKDGFYNFQDINLQVVKGSPIGHIPQLKATNMGADQVMDLSVTRSVGDRLYGPEIRGGDDFQPGGKKNTQRAQLKPGTKIDKYAKTYTILNKECTQIDVNIKLPGLFENLQYGSASYKKSKYLKACRKRSAGKGDTKASTVEYWIFFQPVFDERYGDNTNPNNNSTAPNTQEWIGPTKEVVTGKIDSPYVRTTKLDLSGYNYKDQQGFQGWRIRIVRITSESLTSFIRNPTYIDSIIEVYGNKLRYPYSSMVYSRFDARNFSRIPARAYDTRLLKIKVPNNYDPVTKTYGRSDGVDQKAKTGSPDWSSDEKANCATVDDSFWDGEFKKKTGIAYSQGVQGEYLLEWTNNPAWCFYDLLTNPRYGLGEYLDEDQVDKWSLYEIAQYCDQLVDDGYGGLEPQFTMNYIITSREEAFKVLNDLASIFRGITYYANGSIFAIQDKFKDPVFQFNNSNIAEGNFTYSSSAKRARHTVAIVRYNDKRDFHQPAVEYVEDEEAVRRYGIREIETTALGCTSRGQARRFAKWILASESQETETVSFAVGQEGGYLKPGDVIQIYDNFRSPLKYSGRTNAVRPIIGEGKVTALGNVTSVSTHTAATYSAVSIGGGSGSSLTANIVVSAVGGVIDTVNNFSQGGSRYSGGTYYASLKGGSGTGARATVVVDLALYQVTSVTITDGGTAYSVNDVLYVEGFSLLPIDDIGQITIPAGDGNFYCTVNALVANSISSIEVVNGGVGYKDGDVLTIPKTTIGGTEDETCNPTWFKKLVQSPSSNFDINAFNSVVLDQALEFTHGEKYKFSLLTPTYNYDNQTTSINSTDTKEINRSALQTLFFQGEDTRTITGNYRSDLIMDSGSGVCTEIYFNSGLIAGDANKTGNQLDFDNYVITGYTNSGVQITSRSDPKGESYSGGCFSGENLVWSVEPENPNEFISGNFENYRVVNIQENENNYSVAALAYSTGKYENVIAATTLDSVYVQLTPQFPTGYGALRLFNNNTTEGGVKKKSTAAYSVSNGQPAVQVENDDWQTSRLAPTIEIIFERAGYGEPQNTKTNDAGAIVDLQSSTITPQDDISYIICVRSVGKATPGANGPPYKTATPFNDDDVKNENMAIVDSALFESDYQKDVKLIIGPGTTQQSQYILGDRVHVELFLEERANQYVTVFAQSPEGVLSDGMLKAIRSSKIPDEQPFLSIVKELNITDLKTEGKTATLGVVNVDSMEPAFQWTQSFAAEYWTNDGTNNESPKNRMYPGRDSVDYRITIREPNIDVEGETLGPPVVQSISPNIYIEFTGYAAQSLTPSFIFDSVYNDPDTISGLLADTNNDGYTYQVYDSYGNKVTEEEDRLGGGFIDVTGSGFNIRSDINLFPIRKFDIVVEAHDGAGLTSAGNTVGTKTVNILGTAGKDETFTVGTDVSNRNKFQSFGANIIAPSGIFFAQTKGTMGQVANPSIKGKQGLGTQITSTQAHKNKYPYMARARITADGTLHFAMRETTNTEGETILSESAIEDAFENVRGLVYYCSTGDHTAEMVLNEDGSQHLKYLNPALDFVVQKANIKPLGSVAGKTNSNNYGTVGNAGNNWFGSSLEESIISVPHEKENFRIIRGAYVMKEEDSINGFSMPFPVMGDMNVTNVQLTVGFFDALSLAASFDDDEVTPRIDYLGSKSVKRIFEDKSITFSTVPTAVDNIYTPDAFLSSDPYNFAELKGTPMFVGESSNLSSADQALAFRGWGEISLVIDPKKRSLYRDNPPMDAADYKIVSKTSEYFNPDNITIEIHQPYDSKRTETRIRYTIPLVTSVDVDKYSVFLSTPTYYHLGDPSWIIRKGLVGREPKTKQSDELLGQDGKGVSKALRRNMQVIEKNEDNFVIEYWEISKYTEPLANYITLKFGILISDS